MSTCNGGGEESGGSSTNEWSNMREVGRGHKIGLEKWFTLLKE